MLSRLTSYIRERWHPLWRLRQLGVYRWFQRRCDRTVFARIPGTKVRVALKLLRDASWLASPASLEPEIHGAFTLVLDLFRPAVFWDVGANIGFYSWFVREHPAVHECILFEPDPTNFGLLQATIRKNAIRNCRPLQVALSDSAGEASFLVDPSSGAAGSLESASTRENAHSLQHVYKMDETIKCTTATIDSLVRGGLRAPELIKIDVEGAEHLVLAGAGSFFTEHSPALIIETTNDEFIAQLCARNYLAFRIDPTNLLFVRDRSEEELATIEANFPEYLPVAAPAALQAW